MSTQMVRVSKKTHEEVRELARQLGESMQVIIDNAVAEYRRKRFFEQLNAGYAALQQNPTAWQDHLEEQSLWDGTLADGLDQDDIWTEAESATTCR